MQPFVNILGLTLQAQPLAIAVGFFVASLLAGRTAARAGLRGEAVGDGLLYGALAGLLAARAGYVAANWQAYAGEPLSALAPSLSALSPLTGVPVAAAVALAWWRRKGQHGSALIDALAAPAVVFAIGLALASFFDGAVYGVPSDVPWAVEVWGAARHPVQLYEAVLSTALAAALFRASSRKLPAGAAALAAVAGYALIRVFVDGFRGDDAATVLGLRVTQIAAATIAATAMWLLGELAAVRSADRSEPTAQT